VTQAVTLYCGARQQLALSARLQQAIRLLQMSSERFEQEVQQALVSNPFLRDTRLDDDPTELSDEPTSAVMPADIDVVTPMPTTYDGASRDWDHDDQPMTPPAGGAASLHRDDRADDGDDAVQRLSRVAGLREHLRDQALASTLSVRIHLALEMLIDSIDDDGYLRDDTALLAASLSDELGLKPALSPAGSTRPTTQCEASSRPVSVLAIWWTVCACRSTPRMHRCHGASSLDACYVTGWICCYAVTSFNCGSASIAVALTCWRPTI